MKEALVLASQYCVLIIDALAMIVIFLGTLEAFIGSMGMMFGSPDAKKRRDVWLHYARWLVAGLTFQLAADIIATSIAPSWDEIGRLVTIAVMRTFLNYFLERDLTDIRQFQPAPAPQSSLPK